MTNFIVLDMAIEIQKDSKPTGFEPVALIQIPHVNTGSPFECQVLHDIAETIVEQNCLSGNLPVNWYADETSYDRYSCLEITNDVYDAFEPFVQKLEQTMTSWQVFDKDGNPAAYYGGDDVNPEIAISTGYTFGWLDDPDNYTYKECELTKLRLPSNGLLIKLY